MKIEMGPLQPVQDAVSEVIFVVWDIPVRCYVLENGQRIINAADIDRLMDKGVVNFDDDGFHQMLRWCNGQAPHG